jgi:preprotein translocase subunit SecG
MENLNTILFVLQVIVAVCLIGFILIQHGKGADAGAAFGSGASSTVFGSQGSSNFLTKSTAVLAFIFLGNSLLLAYLASTSVRVQTSVMDQEEIAIVEEQVIEEPVGSDMPEIPISDVPVLPEQ